MVFRFYYGCRMVVFGLKILCFQFVFEMLSVMTFKIRGESCLVQGKGPFALLLVESSTSEKKERS